MSKVDNSFLYWCVGWYLMLRHPISRPIDLAKTLELIVTSPQEDKR